LTHPRPILAADRAEIPAIKQWDGRPHPLDGIDVPKWKCLTTT
jgi:hypothetical protein